MIVHFEISDAEAADYLAGNHAAKHMIRRHIQAAYGAVMCTCGHTRHWHGQEPRQQAGTGACDDCDCKAFTGDAA